MSQLVSQLETRSPCPSSPKIYLREVLRTCFEDYLKQVYGMLRCYKVMSSWKFYTLAFEIQVSCQFKLQETLIYHAPITVQH